MCLFGAKICVFRWKKNLFISSFHLWWWHRHRYAITMMKSSVYVCIYIACMGANLYCFEADYYDKAYILFWAHTHMNIDVVGCTHRSMVATTTHTANEWATTFLSKHAPLSLSLSYFLFTRLRIYGAYICIYAIIIILKTNSIDWFLIL